MEYYNKNRWNLFYIIIYLYYRFTHENKDIFNTFLINELSSLYYYKYINNKKYIVTIIVKNVFCFII